MQAAVLGVHHGPGACPCSVAVLLGSGMGACIHGCIKAGLHPLYCWCAAVLRQVLYKKATGKIEEDLVFPQTTPDEYIILARCVYEWVRPCLLRLWKGRWEESGEGVLLPQLVHAGTRMWTPQQRMLHHAASEPDPLLAPTDQQPQGLLGHGPCRPARPARGPREAGGGAGAAAGDVTVGVAGGVTAAEPEQALPQQPPRCGVRKEQAQGAQHGAVQAQVQGQQQGQGFAGRRAAAAAAAGMMGRSSLAEDLHGFRA